MTDIVTTIKGAVCLPDTGCMSVVTCICDILQDAADEIERLRSVIDATANHWLALQHDYPIKWEGAIDGAMAAACAEIGRLGQDNKDMRLWLSSLEAAGARMSRVWKRAEDIYAEIMEKQESGDD